MWYIHILYWISSRIYIGMSLCIEMQCFTSNKAPWKICFCTNVLYLTVEICINRIQRVLNAASYQSFGRNSMIYGTQCPHCNSLWDNMNNNAPNQGSHRLQNNRVCVKSMDAYYAKTTNACESCIRLIIALLFLFFRQVRVLVAWTRDLNNVISKAAVLIVALATTYPLGLLQTSKWQRIHVGYYDSTRVIVCVFAIYSWHFPLGGQLIVWCQYYCRTGQLIQKAWLSVYLWSRM